MESVIESDFLNCDSDTFRDSQFSRLTIIRSENEMTGFLQNPTGTCECPMKHSGVN